MVVGLSTLISAYGKLFRSRRTVEQPTENLPTITAMIPALNEERTIAYAIVSLAVQTVPPDKVIVVDDGSTDDTPRIVDELSNHLDLHIERWRHEEPKGKTVGMKEVAREVETDTLLNLDADTFIESEDYLERLLAPHLESDVASSFGTVYPTEHSDKKAFYETRVSELLPADNVAHEHVRRDLDLEASRTGLSGYFENNRPIIQYRNIDFHVQQRFFADGILRVFGSMLYPVGSAVLYDRRKLVSVFDAYEDTLGDDLTNSEDLFIGFAFCDRGWSNIRLHDTYFRSSLPGLRKTYKQNYLWGSGYLQSAFYFNQLTFRYRKKKVATDGGTSAETEERREIKGPPRRRGETKRSEESVESEPPEADDDDTETLKQPLGRIITAQIIDGFYPTAALILILLTSFGFIGFALELIALVILLEFTATTIIAFLTRTPRLNFFRNLIPFVLLRAIMLPVLTYTYLRVGTDIITGNRSWRK
jgi:glycosyltransferase involved in cell wall biosynthesis